MVRSGTFLCCLATVLALFIGGCSLVVDFDRSQLVDASVDGGSEAAVDASAGAN